MAVLKYVSGLFGRRNHKTRESPAPVEPTATYKAREPVNPYVTIGGLLTPAGFAYMRGFYGDIFQEAGFLNGDFALLSVEQTRGGIMPVRILASPAGTGEVYQYPDGTKGLVRIIAVAMLDTIPPQAPAWLCAYSAIKDFQELVDMEAVRPILRVYPLVSDFAGELRARGIDSLNEVTVRLVYRPTVEEDVATMLRNASNALPDELRKYLDGMPVPMPLQ